jgi:hypothetical protein
MKLINPPLALTQDLRRWIALRPICRDYAVRHGQQDQGPRRRLVPDLYVLPSPLFPESLSFRGACGD